LLSKCALRVEHLYRLVYFRSYYLTISTPRGTDTAETRKAKTAETIVIRQLTNTNIYQTHSQSSLYRNHEQPLSFLLTTMAILVISHTYQITEFCIRAYQVTNEVVVRKRVQVFSQSYWCNFYKRDPASISAEDVYLVRCPHHISLNLWRI
jgi:hypothetical protein